jgi:hypothetical protein
MCEEMGGTVEAIAEHFWILLLIINAYQQRFSFTLYRHFPLVQKGRHVLTGERMKSLLQNTTANAPLQNQDSQLSTGFFPYMRSPIKERG